MARIEEVVTLENGHVSLETTPEQLANALIRIAKSEVALAVQYLNPKIK